MQIIKETDPQALDLAVKYLNEGKIISFASDTIYGLAVDASNADAIAKLYQLKQRDEEKPIAIFLENIEQAKDIFIFEDLAKKISDKYFPGPLTLVLKLQKEPKFIADNINKNNPEFLGFRIINRDFVNKLLKKSGKILAVTSANISNQPSSLSANQVKNYFKDSNLSLLIDGNECKNKLASTVIKISDNKASILRNGSLDFDPEFL